MRLPGPDSWYAMTLADYFTRRPEFETLPMEERDAVSAAALHAARFAHGWSDGEIQRLLSQDVVFGYVARQSNAVTRPAIGGFVLARAAGGEAEILTVCVDARFARHGLGWRLMQLACRRAREEGADSLFLEVDEANQAAIGLYRKLGFDKVGERRGYYQGPDGARTAALVMRRDLR